MLFVYTNSITPRLEYIFHFILHTICGFDVQFVNSQFEYKQIEGPTLNYSDYTLKETDLSIKPNGLLFEKNIIPLDAFIQSNNGKTELLLKGECVKNQFDLFAASFYLITRYEEYTNFKSDVHGRYLPTQSILHKHHLLGHPLVDAWAFELKAILLQRYPSLTSRQKKFEAFITIDVDQAFAFRNRGFLINGFSFIKNLAKCNFSFVKSQVETLFFNKQDAFDSFDYLKKIQETSQLKFVYFFNVGKASPFDKNLAVIHQAFAKLVKKIQQYAFIGVHPSYYSNEKTEYFVEEKNKLSIASGIKITKSRQHYLKFKLPLTYRHLIKAGIEEDYSMGYASVPGFRAGTCTPFYWFDLEVNQLSTLRIVPITFMEGTFSTYLKLSTTETTEIINHLTEEIKKYNGTYISIWHNHTVNDKFSWKGWRNVFENSIAVITNG